MLGWESSSQAQRAFQSNRIATLLSAELPATSATAWSAEPSCSTSRHRRVSVPACGTSPEWNFSAPAREARHWKNRMPSAPRATCCMLWRSSSPGTLRDVAGLPVDRAGRALHEQPRPPRRDAPDQVAGERELAVGLRVVGQLVVVVGDDVELRTPAEVVHVAGVLHHHQVGGDRHPGREPVQDVALGAVVGEQLVGAEPLEVELLGRVGERGSDPRGQDLVEARVALGPERRAPGVVEPLDVGVAVRQPAAERLGAHVAVAQGVVAAQLVADVPERERLVAGVPLGHRGAQPQRVLHEHRRARAVALPPARPQGRAVGGRPAGSPGAAPSARAGARRWPWRGRRGSRRRAGGPGPRPASRTRSARAPARASAHEKTPTVTRLTPACCMRRTSSAWTSVDHCSGL